MISSILSLWLAASPAFQSINPETLLGEPYRDGTFGFSIRPPKNWQITRERKSQRVGLTVLRMARQMGMGVSFEFNVRVSRTLETFSVQATLDELSKALMLERKNAVIGKDSGTRVISGKPGGFLSATFELDGQRMVFYATIIQNRAKQYYIIVYSGPDVVGDKVLPLYQAVVDSFQVLETDRSDAQIRRALLDGTDWLNSISSKDLRDIKPQESWFGVYRGEQLLGFEQIASEFGEIVTGVRKGRNGSDQYLKLEGLRVREQGWTFETNGVIRRSFNEMFVTDDLSIERWKFVTLIYTPPVSGRRADINLSIEEGAKESGQIITSQRYGLAAPSTPNDPITAPLTYVPRALLRVLPQMVGNLAKRRLLAFHEFDHAIRGLRVETVDLTGQVATKTPTPGKTFFRLREREGLFGPHIDSYVTAAGRLVKIVAGPTTLKVTKREKLEQQFGQKVADAERAFADVDKEYNELHKRFVRKDLTLSGPAPAAAPKPAGSP